MQPELHTPLDHATARIVEELSALLLPSLKKGIEESAVKASSLLPDLLEKELDKTLSSLNRVQGESERLYTLLQKCTHSAEGVAAELFPRFEDGVKVAEKHVNRMEALVLSLESQSETLNENRRLLLSFDNALPEWEGILKANARAQSRELSGFAAEVSELLRDAKVTLLHSLKEAIEENIAMRAIRFSQEAEAREKALEARFSRLEKVMYFCGFFSLALLTVLLVMFIL